MRTTQEIESQIIEVKGKINSLTLDIKKQEASLEELKRSNVALIVKSAGLERKPKSLTSQAENIRMIEIEAEANRQAVEILQGQLEELEQERDLSEIFAGPYQAYRESHENFLNRVDQVRTLFDNVLKAGNELRTSIGNSLASSPLPHLSTLLSSIDYDSENLKELGGELPLDTQGLLVEFVGRENQFEIISNSMRGFSSMLNFMQQHQINMDQVRASKEKEHQDLGPQPARHVGTHGFFIGENGEALSRAPRSTGLARMHEMRKKGLAA